MHLRVHITIPVFKLLCISKVPTLKTDLLPVPKGAEELGDELVGAAQHYALLAEDVLLLLRLHDVLLG